MNQFVDGTMILITNPHRVGFLVAEKSYNQRIIGDLAKAAGAIPVSRPQDKADKGNGEICFKGLTMIGRGTKFTSLKKGDKIRPGRSPEAYKVGVIIHEIKQLGDYFLDFLRFETSFLIQKRFLQKTTVIHPQEMSPNAKWMTMAVQKSGLAMIYYILLIKEGCLMLLCLPCHKDSVLGFSRKVVHTIIQIYYH